MIFESLRARTCRVDDMGLESKVHGSSGAVVAAALMEMPSPSKSGKVAGWLSLTMCMKIKSAK